MGLHSIITVNHFLPYKNYLLFSFCCLFIISNTYAANLSSTVASNKRFTNDEVIPGELLVKFKQPLTRSKARAKAGRYKARSKSQFRNLGIEHWKLDSTQNLRQVIAELEADPNVVLVEPNYRRYPRTVSSRTISYPRNEVNLTDVNLLKLWEIDEITYRKANKVKVAVIDDGFFTNHEDLNANITYSYNAIDLNNDASPQVCVEPGTSTPFLDENGQSHIEPHGTLVMGVVGAVSNNFKGIDGAADNASMMAIRIGCNYSVSYELVAFSKAIENGADIINISWGGPQFSEMERLGIVDMLKEDILIVTAAGNFDADNDRVLDYPSGLDLPNILSVAAINDSKKLTEWTQYGQTKVDIAAPGEDIVTLSKSGNYVQASGTSFSAPFVAGVAASLLARSPEGTSALDVKAAILSSATPFSDGLKGRLVTDGYIDAFAAYEALNSPKPLPVIAKIEVDDSVNMGNNNGLVDPGEIVNLNITVENTGLKADTMSALLTSTTLGVNKFASVSNVPGFDSINYQYGQVELVFEGVDFSEYYQAQNIEFALHLTSHFGREFVKVSRYFSIDTGSLAIDTPVNNIIRINDDNQDEFHYYHINLDSAQKELNITLTMAETDSDIDILVKYGSPPGFNYDEYETLALDRFETGTVPGVDNGENEVVTIKNASSGVYHVVVIADPDKSKTNMAYTLSATTTSRTFTSVAQGCSIGNMVTKSNSIDPVFYLLLLFSLLRIYRYSRH